MRLPPPPDGYEIDPEYLAVGDFSRPPLFVKVTEQPTADIDFSNFPDGSLSFVRGFSDLSKGDLARMVRDMLLVPTDFRMVSDAPWDRDAWAAYRQALRDLPAHPEWPDMQFPEPPVG